MRYSVQPLSKRQQQRQAAGSVFAQPRHECASRRRDAALARRVHNHCSRFWWFAPRQARKLGFAQSKHRDVRSWCGLHCRSLDAVACHRSARPGVDGCFDKPLQTASLIPDALCRSCPCRDCRRWTHGFDAGRAAVTAANTLRRAGACAGSSYTSSGQRRITVLFVNAWGTGNDCTCIRLPSCITVPHTTCAAPRFPWAA